MTMTLATPVEPTQKTYRLPERVKTCRNQACRQIFRDMTLSGNTLYCPTCRLEAEKSSKGAARRSAKTWYKPQLCLGMAHRITDFDGHTVCGVALDPGKMVRAEKYTYRCPRCMGG